MLLFLHTIKQQEKLIADSFFCEASNYFNKNRGKKHKTFVRKQEGEEIFTDVLDWQNPGNRGNANKFSDNIFATCSLSQDVTRSRYSLFRIICDQNKCHRPPEKIAVGHWWNPFPTWRGDVGKEAECNGSTMPTSTCPVQWDKVPTCDRDPLGFLLPFSSTYS